MRPTCLLPSSCAGARPRVSGMGTESEGKQRKGPSPISSIQGCPRPEGTCSPLSSPALFPVSGHLRVSMSPGASGAGAEVLPGPTSDTPLLPAVPSWAQTQATGHPGGEVWSIQAEIFSGEHQVQPVHS